MQIGLDEAGGGGGSVNLPPIVENAEWPQAGGTISHAPGHPALGRGLVELWRSSVGTGSSAAPAENGTEPTSATVAAIATTRAPSVTVIGLSGIRSRNRIAPDQPAATAASGRAASRSTLVIAVAARRPARIAAYTATR